jgi:hypothetical protein
MTFTKFFVTAMAFTVLLLGAVVANAVLAPMPTRISTWTTVVTPYCSRCLNVSALAEGEQSPATR